MIFVHNLIPFFGRKKVVFRTSFVGYFFVCQNRARKGYFDKDLTDSNTRWTVAAKRAFLNEKIIVIAATQACKVARTYTYSFLSS